MRVGPDTTGATSNLSAAEPYLAVRVDRAKAASLGLTETQVGGLVAASVSPRDTGTVEIDDATLDVYIADPEPPTTIAALRGLSVPTRDGLRPAVRRRDGRAVPTGRPRSPRRTRSGRPRSR